MANTKLLSLVLVLVPLVLYMPAMRGEFLWDDFDHISESRVIRSPDGLYNIVFNPRSLPFPFGGQYYPLVYGSFWIEYRLWKLNPEGYHLPNILLHGGSAALIFWLLRRLRVRGAWLAAMMFAVHPVHVESVAWITERKNTLSLFLALIALRCYLPLAELEVDSRAALSRRQHLARYVGALLLFVGSLLAKTVTCSWPAVVLVMQYWKRGVVRRKDVLAMIPFFAVGLLAGLPTIHAEEQHVGASGSDFDLPLLNRFLLAGKALWFYAIKLTVPYPLSFFYHRWEIDSHSVTQRVLLIAALVVPVALFGLRNRIGRGALAAFLIFAGVLFPALGFFKVYPMLFSWVADHFQYHASIAWIVLLSAGAIAAMSAFEDAFHVSAGKVIVPVCTVWLGVLGGLTWDRAHLFSSQELLWRHTLRYAPDAWIVHQNLGVLLRRKGELDDAKQQLLRAMELRPQNPAIHHNLGVIAQQRGQLVEAEAHYRKALEYDARLGSALVNLGAVLLLQNRPDDAIEYFRRATEAIPSEPKAWLGLGEALRQTGDKSQSEECLQRAEKLSAQP